MRNLITMMSILALLILANSHPASAQLNIEDTIVAVAWSPDGNNIAAGMSDGLINIWDTQNPQIIATLIGHTGAINHLAWDGNSNYLASASMDQTVRVWDVSSGGALLYPPLAHNDLVTSVIWSVDDSKIISIDRVSAQNLYVWNAITGMLDHTLATGGLLQMKFSPSASRLAIANPGGIIEFRNGADYVYIDYLQYPERTGTGFDVYTIDWNSDGNQIVAGSLNGTVRSWDTTTYGMLLDLQGSNSQEVGLTTTLIQDVMYSQDDTRIASISADGVLRIWDSDNGAVLTEMQLPQPINASRFSPDGTQLAYGGDETSFAIVNVPQGTTTCDHDISASDTATITPSTFPDMGE